MKYIKTYESVLIYTYNIGDYVILNLDEIIKNYIKDNEIEPNKKDLPDDKIGQFVSFRDEENYPFAIKFHNDTIFEVKEEEILRKATQEEINNIQIKLTANKYNL